MNSEGASAMTGGHQSAGGTDSAGATSASGTQNVGNSATTSQGGAGAGGTSASVAGGGMAGGAAGGSAGTRGSDTPLGCGKIPGKMGNFEVEIASGGAQRRLTLSVPDNYNPMKAYRLIVGYHGRDYDGARMRQYLRLDTVGDPRDSLFVYPWGGMVNGFIGWQLGEYGGPYGGGDDLVFFDDMMDYIAEHYCLDTSRVFVTGQSWGGDMTHFITCFRGDRVRAGVAVAANGDYYLPPNAGDCLGHPDIYTLHGRDDDSIPFNPQGLACRAFWEREHGCDGGSDPLDPDQCEELSGCSARTVWCPYGPNNGGHQVPNWYAATTMQWFRSY